MPKYDTYIELVPEAEQATSRKACRYGFKRHIAVRGFQKLINQWMKCFLTLQGTNLSDRQYGTLFPQLIGANVTSRRDIVEAVQIAVDKANEDMFRLQNARPSDDPTELLQDARLEALEINASATGFAAFVRLRNQAKQSLQFQIPPMTEA